MPAVPRWEVLCTCRAQGTNRYVLEGRRGHRQWVGLTAASHARLQGESTRARMIGGPGGTAAWAWTGRTRDVRGSISTAFPRPLTSETVFPTLESQEVWRLGLGV